MKVKINKGVQLVNLSFSNLTEGQYSIIKSAISLYGGPAANEINKAIDLAEGISGDNIDGGLFRRSDKL